VDLWQSDLTAALINICRSILAGCGLKYKGVKQSSRWMYYSTTNEGNWQKRVQKLTKALEKVVWKHMVIITICIKLLNAAYHMRRVQVNWPSSTLWRGVDGHTTQCIRSVSTRRRGVWRILHRNRPSNYNQVTCSRSENQEERGETLYNWHNYFYWNFAWRWKAHRNHLCTSQWLSAKGFRRDGDEFWASLLAFV